MGVTREGCRSCGQAGGRVQRVLVVQTPADLRLLKTWRRHYDSVQVRLAAIADDERVRIKAQIDRDYFACGCRPARWAAFAVFAGAVIALLLARGSIPDLSWPAWVNIGLIAMLIPMATMLVAIFQARMRLWRVLDRMVTHDWSGAHAS